MLRNLLGHDVVLLPVVHGQKMPMIAGWQQKTSEDMRDAGYLAALSNGNIGVLLGAPSGNLCAIDIDDDAAVEPFLELNPNLRNTLRSRGARGQQVWLRITGEYPVLSKLVTSSDEPWGEWRANGGQSVIHGMHPSGTPYRIIHEAHPIEMRFEEMRWPEALKLPWLQNDGDELAIDYGPPWIISKGGTVQLNHAYWAAHYQTEHTIVYDNKLAAYYEYNEANGAWEEKIEEQIKRDFANSLNRAATENQLDGLRLQNTAATAGALVNLLRIQIGQANAFRQSREDRIHVSNGMLCREGNNVVLKSHSPEYYSRNVCPYPFDASAQCPRFINELLASALSEEDIILLQKWAGACLMGKNRAQRIMLLTGTAGGGKSTIMSIIEKVIGTCNVASLRTSQLGGRFESASFVGKTLLTGKDVPSDFLMQKSTSHLKGLTGGDLQNAEKKGQNDRIEFTGEFNVSITCNTNLQLLLEGDADAWRRRLLIIPFDKPKTQKPIQGFAEQLLAEEGPGILRWMVEGAVSLMADLEETGNYKLSERQLDNIDRLLSDGDSIDTFVTARVVKAPDEQILSRELKTAYIRFCDEKGIAPLPESQLPQLLRSAMQRVHRAVFRHDLRSLSSTANRGYRGVAIRTEDADETAN